MSAVLRDQLRYGRFRVEWLKQLNKVRSIAHLQQNFTNPIRSQHLLTVNLAKSEQFVSLHLKIYAPQRHRDRDVINELNAGNIAKIQTDFSSKLFRNGRTRH